MHEPEQSEGGRQVQIVLNGTEVAVDEPATAATVVRRLGHDPSVPGVAVAVDGIVVRRVDWADTVLEPGAVVEVLTAVQGGA